MHIPDNSIVWNLRSTLVKNLTLKSGASGSLLMHTMVWDSFIPAWCWMEPLTPQPMYREGRITFPVWPTWRLDSSIPMSTAARVPPTTHDPHLLRLPAPPILSARSKISWNCSFLPTPRPPTTTRDAVDKLGLHMRENAKHHRPDWILDSFTTFE